MSLQTSPQFVAEMTVYDPSIASTRVLRYAVKGLVTKPAETPANTFIDERVTQPIDIQRTMFASRATRGRSTTAYGQLVLINSDGALDVLNEYGFDGRPITILRTTTYNAVYPSDYTTILLGTMQSAEFTLNDIRVTVRDRLYEATSTPLQANRYAGSNVLPDGLEGVPEDLGGKVKPVCLGVVKNVPAPCVNTSKLIYQVNDGAIASVDNVYDRGVSLRTSVTWQSGSSTGSAVRFLGGLFLAGDFSASPTFGEIKTSPDGVTWTSRQTGLGQVSDFAFGNATYLAITDSEFLTSSDAVTWSTQTLPTLQSGNFFRGATYHDVAALFVVCGTGGEIYTSPDATTWTQRAAGTASPGPSPNSGGLWCAGYGNGMAALGGAGGLILSSADCVNWAKRSENTSTDGYSGNLFAIAFGLDRFVGVGTQVIVTSLDGVNWDRTQTTETFFGVMYADVFIAPTLSLTPKIYSSVDGYQWIITKAPYTSFANGCAANGNVSVIAESSLLKSAIQGYSSESDLLNDDLAPMAGCYTEYAAGGYFRLGGTPDGIVTADVTEGATAADRTAAQLSSDVLGRLASTPSFASGDVTALDGLDNSEGGYWTMDDGVTCATVLDFLAGTVGASWYVGNDGAFHIAQLDAPSGTADLTLTANDITKIERVTSSDANGSIPPWKIQVRWGQYYQTITTDLAGAVTDEARAQFAQQWRDVTAHDDTILTAHPSSQVLVIESGYSTEADAQAEADRQLTLRGTQRDMYDITVELNDETAVTDINDVIEVIHPRFSLGVISSPSGALDGGGLFRVLDVRPDAKNARVTFTVWGGSQYKSGATDTGILMATSGGVYGVAYKAA